MTAWVLETSFDSSRSARADLWETCDLFTAMLHAWTKVRTARLAPRLALLRHHVGRLGLEPARDRQH